MPPSPPTQKAVIWIVLRLYPHLFSPHVCHLLITVSGSISGRYFDSAEMLRSHISSLQRKRNHNWSSPWLTQTSSTTPEQRDRTQNVVRVNQASKSHHTEHDFVYQHVPNADSLWSPFVIYLLQIISHYIVNGVGPSSVFVSFSTCLLFQAQIGTGARCTLSETLLHGLRAHQMSRFTFLLLRKSITLAIIFKVIWGHLHNPDFLIH